MILWPTRPLPIIFRQLGYHRLLPAQAASTKRAFTAYPATHSDYMVVPPVSEAKRQARAPVHAKPSASLILLAPTPTVTEDGFNYRVCLLRRNDRMKMSPSATVFPGGNLDAADKEAAKSFARTQDSEEDGNMTALRICALRETLEECGTLVVDPPLPTEVEPKQLAKWRAEVYAKPEQFMKLYERLSSKSGEKCGPPLQDLPYWSRWTTPLGQAKRFDTTFFLYILPPTDDLEHPLITADGTETLSASWQTPRETITSCIQKNEIILFPPQLYLLAELARLKTWQAVKEHGRTRVAQEFLPRLREVLVPGEESRRIAFVYPGDEDYEKVGQGTPGGNRHRSYAAFEPGKEGKLRPKAPIQVLGLHRRGIKGHDDLSEGNVFEASGTPRARL